MFLHTHAMEESNLVGSSELKRLNIHVDYHC